MYRHTLLCCAPQILRVFCLFVLQMEGCSNPVASKSVGSIFATALAHFVSHSLVVLTVFQTFPLSYLLR